MFGLFNGNKKKSLETDVVLMKTIFSSLGKEYSYIINQLNDNIISGVKRQNSPIPNYRKFSLNVDILNKYEDKNGKYFSVKGVKVYDNNVKQYVELQINIGFGILQGYATLNVKEFNPEVSNVNIKNYSVEVFGEGTPSIKDLFTKEELVFLNVNDVYEVELKGKVYFHIKDLDDGDFIAVDENKDIFKITHDPFEITRIEGKFIDILKSS
jgi:hypothetical protein